MLKRHRLIVLYSLFFLLFVFTAGVVLSPFSPINGLRGEGRIAENGSALFDIEVGAEEVLASPKKDVTSPLVTMTVILIVLAVFITGALFRKKKGVEEGAEKSA